MGARWTEKDLLQVRDRLPDGPRRRPEFLIGIDCGVETGFSLYHVPQKRLFVCECMKIHRAMDRVRNFPVSGLLVRIEDARLRKWIPYQDTEKGERGRREGAGSVKRDAIVWEDALTEWGIAFEMVAPKDNKTKLDDDSFRRLTGFEGRTNEHARDSALLVWGF
jgi:hypothetical protein